MTKLPACLLAAASTLPAQGPISVRLHPGAIPGVPSIESDWVSPVSGQAVNIYDQSVRMQIRGPEGAWVRPVFDFELVLHPGETTDPNLSTTPTWLRANQWLLNDQGPVVGASNLWAVNNYGTPFVGVDHLVQKPLSMNRWLTFGFTNGAPQPNPAGATNWLQPILTLSGGQNNVLEENGRVWTAEPPLWPAGGVSNTMWAGAMEEVDGPNPDIFSSYSGVRYALLEHCLFTTGNLNAATALFNSPAWTHMLNGSRLLLVIQVLSARVEVPPANWNDDFKVPKIWDNGPPPEVSMSPGSKFMVIPPQEHNIGYHRLDSSEMVPGQRFYWSDSNARFPFFVLFPIRVNGVLQRQVVAATSVASPTKPGLYCIPVPSNFDPNSDLGAKNGTMVDFLNVATQQPIQFP
ncbi:MAG: hypothetical protein AB8H80_18360 [Planctomycetota bacterium]